jgi:hypothetical protein
VKNVTGEEIGAATKQVDDLLGDTINKIKGGEILQSPKERAEIWNTFGRDVQPGEMVAQLKNEYMFNQNRIADRIDKELIKPNLQDPNLENEVRKLESLRDSYRRNGPVDVSMGQQIKSNKRRGTNFNSETIPASFSQDVYKIVSEELADTVGKTGSLLQLNQGKMLGGIPAENNAIEDSFKAANKKYGIMADAENSAKNRLALEAGHRQLSLTDYIAMLGGLMSGKPGYGVAAGLANKASRHYGPGVQADLANKASNYMSQEIPQSVRQEVPAFIKSAQSGAPAMAAGQTAVNDVENHRTMAAAARRKRIEQYMRENAKP